MSDSPVKMMIEVAFGRHQPGTKANAPDAATLAAVANAAEVWWKARKPADWTLEQHLANPTINCEGDGERQLAQAAAKWVALKK
jgi:hypothetical protein